MNPHMYLRAPIIDIKENLMIYSQLGLTLCLPFFNWLQSSPKPAHEVPYSSFLTHRLASNNFTFIFLILVAIAGSAIISEI